MFNHALSYRAVRDNYDIENHESRLNDPYANQSLTVNAGQILDCKYLLYFVLKYLIFQFLWLSHVNIK